MEYIQEMIAERGEEDVLFSFRLVPPHEPHLIVGGSPPADPYKEIRRTTRLPTQYWPPIKTLWGPSTRCGLSPHFFPLCFPFEIGYVAPIWGEPTSDQPG